MYLFPGQKLKTAPKQKKSRSEARRLEIQKSPQEERFTKPFLEALERVIAVKNEYDTEIEGWQAARRAFKEEMLNLGWKERICNLYRIRDKETNKYIIFKPNEAQSNYLENRKGRDIILKSRQIGFTTFSCIYAYDRAIWDGWDTGIMSHKSEHVKKIFNIVKRCNEWFIKDWGKFYSPAEEQNNTTRLSWKDLQSSITVAYNFQGLTVRFLHVSEAAFVERDRLSNSLQSVPETGEVIHESTPNGRGGYFFDQWQAWRNRGENAPYRGHFYDWPSHYPEEPARWRTTEPLKYTEYEQEAREKYHLEDYHLLWRRWKIAESFEGSEEKFDEQYPLDDVVCFLSGSNSVYPPSVLKYQESFNQQPSTLGYLKKEGSKIRLYADSKDGMLSVYTLPQAQHSYVIGADVSGGYSKDFSSADVICQQTGEQVAQFHGKLEPDDFAEELYLLGMFYNMAWICPEANNHGHTTIQGLIERRYRKIYQRKALDVASNKMTMKLGFLTTHSNKLPITDALLKALRYGDVKIKCSDTITELSNFTQESSKSGRYVTRNARQDCNDDRVMSLALALEMHKDRPISSFNEYEEYDQPQYDAYSGMPIY